MMTIMIATVTFIACVIGVVVRTNEEVENSTIKNKH